MLDQKGLKRIAAKNGVPQAVVEKDYALSVALAAISSTSLAAHLVFKGGTAIRKVYFGDARFSEDLDFTAIGIGKSDCLDELKIALHGKTIQGIVFDRVEEEPTSAGLKAAIKYQGPLGHPQRIRLDLSFRENLVQAPVKKMLIDVYGLGEHDIGVLTLDELFAEKLHALGSREAPRDLYDTWYLLGKGVKIDRDVLDKKFTYYNEKFDVETALRNARQSKKDWAKDLRHLVDRLPDFDKLFEDVEKQLKQI